MSQTTPTSPPSAPAARPKVLIVEDEFLIRLTLLEVLMDEGYDVLEAENGPDALALLQADPAIDLLLTDIQMPGGMDGHSLSTRARQFRPDLPVIFMTGAPENADGQVPGTRNAYLAKPYSPSDMCTAVKQMLAAKPA